MIEEPLGAQMWARTYFLEGEGLRDMIHRERSIRPLSGHGSSWSLSEVTIFFAEPEYANCSLERKQAYSAVSRFL